MKNKSQLKAGAILSYASIVLNIVAGLLYTPWMKDQIGQASFGLYTLANSLITLFLVDFGLSTAVSRYVSKYRAEGNQEKIDKFLGAVYKLYLLIDAIILVALVVIFFLIDKIYGNLTPSELENFKVIYVISSLFAVINFPCVTFNGILNAYEKFVPLKMADVIYRVLLVGITITALLLNGGLYALVAVHAIVGLVVIVYKFIVIKKTTPVKVNFKNQEKGIFKEIFSFSIWVTIASLAQRLIFNITPTIISTVVEAASVTVAVFGIVSTLEGYTFTVTGAINGMFMPRIAKLYEEKGENADLTPLLMKVGKFQFALNSLIVVGFFTIGKSFITLWTGPQDIDAYWGLLLVCAPGIFYNSLQIANTAMVVRKKVHIQAIVNCIMGGINIGLAFVLSYYYGVIGACLSICVAYTVRAVLLLILYNKHLEVSISKFIKSCYIRMLIPLLLSGGFGYLMNHFFERGGWINLIIRGSIIVVVYAILLYLIGLNRSEKQTIHKTVKKIFNKIFKRKKSNQKAE